MKILNTIGSNFSVKAREVLPPDIFVDYGDLPQIELEQKIGDYDAAVIGLGLNFDRNILSKAKNLKVIATATTGLDHIDMIAAKEQGIEILSLRGEEEFLSSITSTAELAFGLLLDLSRQISHSFESVKNYQWERESFRGHSLSQKVLGIVGFGRLGKMMARYGQAFGMRVIACDPFIDKKVFQEQSVEAVAFETLLSESDAISIHVHLNADTENMFSESVFSSMKSGALLINTSRGKIVNEEDIKKALESGTLGGYATDVLTDEVGFEKNFSSHPLVEYAKTHSNCIITPHIGGMTYESREATDIFIVKKLKKYLENI